jgi:Methyltransferase domain
MVRDVITQNSFWPVTDSFNIDKVDFLVAAIDSSEYVSKYMFGVQRYSNALDLLDVALRQALPSGLILEFGVFSGRTINHLASLLPLRQIYGFDSFEGLPEDWRPGYARGTFRIAKPRVADNVELIVGWFHQSLPEFLSRSAGEFVAFLHIDCDLYSSTRTIFDLLGDQIGPGTIIVFDEYFNYPQWRQHEFLAFQEFIVRRCLRYEYIGLVPEHQQVAVRIIAEESDHV